MSGRPFHRITGQLTVGGWPLVVRAVDADDDSGQQLRSESHLCDWCYLNIPHTVRLHDEEVGA